MPIYDRSLTIEEVKNLEKLIEEIKKGTDVDEMVLEWVLERTDAAVTVIGEVEKRIEDTDSPVVRLEILYLLSLCFYNWQLKWPGFCREYLNSEISWVWGVVVSDQTPQNLASLEEMLSSWQSNSTFTERTLQAMSRAFKLSQRNPRNRSPSITDSDSSCSTPRQGALIPTPPPVPQTPPVPPEPVKNKTLEIQPGSYLSLLRARVIDHRRGKIAANIF
eukprot:TRINITY_DN1617_c0_g1_i2.p1 TRINITY_DN1617_c0_g1~~TRINITY_DN1617_c0_g1_i2.p1  ORF type:complete len:238 (+),score=32.18 TRINITY_DN1617_c0_g1_i2:60-716(+)